MMAVRRLALALVLRRLGVVDARRRRLLRLGDGMTVTLRRLRMVLVLAPQQQQSGCGCERGADGGVREMAGGVINVAHGGAR